MINLLRILLLMQKATHYGITNKNKNKNKEKERKNGYYPKNG